MSSASNAVGNVGKFAQVSFTSIASSTQARKTPKKFFPSRNCGPGTPAGAAPTTPAAPKFRTPAPASAGVDADGGKNVRVAVRVRPVLAAERVAEDAGQRQDSVVEVNENEGQLFVNLTKTFKFDYALSPDCNQATLYRSTVQPLVTKFMENPRGLNAAVLAYGQTGTGKTYTMGTDYSEKNSILSADDLGIIPRVLQDIFSGLSGACTVKVSFFEILKGDIFDLLNANLKKVPLKINPTGSAITDLTSKSVFNEAEALRYLEQGSSTRSKGATAQNESSSRSHAIFRLTLERYDEQHGLVVSRRLSLVDLAGSESVGRALTEGDRQREGASINKSLSALSRCITAICDHQKHVPFMDTNLTKVLRECFVSGGLTTMIACISPCEADLKETMSTLRYADEVKRMKKPPLPPHLAEKALHNMSAHKRRLQMIPPTPAKRLNNTIETPTPTKKKPDFSAGLRMNSTFDTPSTGFSSFYHHSTSSKMPSMETIVDEDISDLSSIRNNSICSSSVKNATSLFADIGDARAAMSPFFRQMTETLKQHVESTIKSQFARKPRLTSSPRRSPRFQAGKENVLDHAEFSIERKSIRDSTSFAKPGETLLGPATPKGLCDVTNLRKRNHLRKVEETASPDLPGKEKVTPPEPSMEEKAKAMGFDFNSPSLLFSCRRVPSQETPRSSAKRSVRRTTMLQPDIRQSIMEMKAQRPSRRSIRIASFATNAQQVSPPGEGRHALNVKSYWKDVPRVMQESHNLQILNILNTSNPAMLQCLPGIGMKSAIILHSYRELHQKFSSLEELQKVPGLPKNCVKNFFTKNQIVLA